MTDTTKTTYIDIQEFRELGFLQEVNRLVLHPCGLALQASSPWSLEQLAELLRTADIELGPRALVRLHKVLGYDRWTLTGVWDYRHDPEGVVFSDLTEDDDATRARHVVEETGRHLIARQALFGSLVQPLGSKVDSETIDAAAAS